MSTNDKSGAPPYGSFETFKSFIADLAKMDGAVQSHVDRSILRKMSGASQSGTLMALRFLGLIEDDEAGTAKPGFETLVLAKRKGEPAWREALLPIVEAAYAPIVGSVNVAATTPEKLEAAFKAKNIRVGEMLEKSVRFYLKAMQDAGGIVHPSLLQRRPRVPRKPKPPKDDATGAAAAASKTVKTAPHVTPKTDPKATDDVVVPEGFARQNIPTIPGACIVYPLEMSATNYALFEAALAFIKVVTTAKGD